MKKLIGADTRYLSLVLMPAAKKLSSLYNWVRRTGRSQQTKTQKIQVRICNTNRRRSKQQNQQTYLHSAIDADRELRYSFCNWNYQKYTSLRGTFGSLWRLAWWVLTHIFIYNFIQTNLNHIWENCLRPCPRLTAENTAFSWNSNQ